MYIYIRPYIIISLKMEGFFNPKMLPLSCYPPAISQVASWKIHGI